MTQRISARAVGRQTINTGLAILLAAVLLAVSLAGLVASSASAQDPVKVGVMFTQNAGDKGPIDDMILFLTKAEEDFGVETTFVEALDPSTYEGILRNMALEGHTIIAGTFNEVAEPFKALAPEFPDVRFIQIFGDPFDPELPNVVTVAYDYYLGTYLAGLLAGQATQTGQLGYIGGVSLPPLNADYHSYTQAAGEIDPANTTTFAWAGSFQDPVKGRELAAAQYAAGVDFIQTDAAATDLGIVEAAKEKDGFVIGGFEAIYDQAPANVVGVVAIFFGQSLYDQIGNALSDDYAAGHFTAGLHDGVVDLLISERFLAEGPAEMVAAIEAAIPAVDAARQGILDGTVDVVFNTEAP
jgi:basic membrane protein A